MSIHRVHVVDTHTGGEPTRVVAAGGPELGGGSLSARRDLFRRDFDGHRSAVVNEPRGSDVMVGALLVPATDSACAAGVIFFNNVGYLNMCGHGTMGVAVALGYLGRIKAGSHRLETPVGVVRFDYDGANTVSIENVPAYRAVKHVEVEVAGAVVRGDIAWGGNWFFLVDLPDWTCVGGAGTLIERLSAHAWAIRQALEERGITGEHGSLIDHIEISGPPVRPDCQSRNFVLCPGRAYDRSPCGTGTSAKLACLAAEGALKPGEIWRQESIIGSVFEGSYRLEGEALIPRITGTAFVNGEATIILDERDPYCFGVRPSLDEHA